MSDNLADQIHQLIEADPSQLHVGARSEFIVAHALEVFGAAQAVLELYHRSRTVELDRHQRNILRRRLLNAAGQVQILIDEDDFNVRKTRPIGRLNIQLFNRIAAELQMEPQELQIRV